VFVLLGIATSASLSCGVHGVAAAEDGCLSPPAVMSSRVMCTSNTCKVTHVQENEQQQKEFGPSLAVALL